jgi:hypothetical protein
MSYEPFASRPPAPPAASPQKPVTAPQGDQNPIPRLSGHPDADEATREAILTRDLRAAHEVIARLEAQRPVFGACGCPSSVFDSEGVCLSADCEHPQARHESGRCDVPVGDLRERVHGAVFGVLRVRYLSDEVAGAVMRALGVPSE